MWVVERIDEKGYYHLENLKTGETILKRGLNARDFDSCRASDFKKR